MYAYIAGKLASKLIGKTSNSVVIDCNGVGYELKVSTATLASIGQTGETAKLFTYLQVKEDILGLYGFITMEEKNMFIKCISISGVGPKVGLNILSGMTPAELAIALVAEDVKSITRIPGIGKRTAERLILELKEKVDAKAMTSAMKGNKFGMKPVIGVGQEALQALMALGYTSTEAARAVSAVDPSVQDIEGIIINALRNLDS